MRRLTRRFALTPLALAGAICATAIASAAADELGSTSLREKLAESESVPWRAPRHLHRLLQPQLQKQEAELATARVNFRDPAAVDVFSKAAPAVVYITDGATGHGTGLFVRDSGWILTNNHVVEGMPYSADHGGQVARIVYGKRNTEGAMQVVPGYLEAVVHARDETRDLALLKLVKLPTGMSKVPSIQMAAKSPPAGTSCYAIGHPSSGVLWTLRVGVISGHGRHPHDHLIGGLLLGVDPKTKREVELALEKLPYRRTTLSTCGVNPGDSGGPLLDENGKLIAVTYAVPADVGDRSFSYHVDLKEVKAFLAKWPDTPRPTPPTAVPMSRSITAVDLDVDKIPETLVFSLDRKMDPTGIWIDLDQDSPAAQAPKELQARLSTLDPAADWDAEFAMVALPRPAHFFDTDNDKQFDLIIIPHNDQKSIQLVLKAGRWTVSTVSETLPNEPFKSATLNKRWQMFAQLFK